MGEHTTTIKTHDWQEILMAIGAAKERSDALLQENDQLRQTLKGNEEEWRSWAKDRADLTTVIADKDAEIARLRERLATTLAAHEREQERAIRAEARIAELEAAMGVILHQIRSSGPTEMVGAIFDGREIKRAEDLLAVRSSAAPTGESRDEQKPTRKKGGIRFDRRRRYRAD